MTDAVPFRIVIPARFASSRLPGKPLLDIGGKPMIQYVYELALKTNAKSVVVATDDDRIQKAATGFGAQVMMTRSDHQSGTDRVAEVAEKMAWDDDDIIVNVQGDEPELPSPVIVQVASLLARDTEAGIATLCSPIVALDDFLNPDVVKVVRNSLGHAVYFSRAPIPWHRDHAKHGFASQREYAGAQRHVGLYAYRVATVKQLAAAKPCDWETIEHLEQLRALWLGIKICMDEAKVLPPPGIDNAEDLEAARKRIP